MQDIRYYERKVIVMPLYIRSTIQVLCLHLVMIYLETRVLLNAHGFSVRYQITTHNIEKLGGLTFGQTALPEPQKKFREKERTRTERQGSGSR